MDFSVAWSYKSLLLDGFLTTVGLSILIIITGTIVGLVAALMRNSKYFFLKYPAKIYIDILRGSPILMQLFLVYFGLPYIVDFSIDVFQAAILSFTLYGGAYIAEIIRSGIESIPKGQYEAAHSIGLSNSKVMQKVILPQTTKVAVPPLVGFYLSLIKDTSVASIIGYVELVHQGQSIIGVTSKPFEVFIVIACLYFVICYPLSLYVNWLERRLNYS